MKGNWWNPNITERRGYPVERFAEEPDGTFWQRWFGGRIGPIFFAMGVEMLDNKKINFIQRQENESMGNITFKPIGIIHTPFKEPKGTPIQAAAGKDVGGTIEVFPEFAEGLEDLDGFSHIILLYHFHLYKGLLLKAKPFMDDREHGVFAIRSPARPNPIGLSVVRLMKMEGATLFIRDVDILDDTPLLDIKPYVPKFDHRDVTKIGWLEKNVDKLPHSKDDGRFAK